MIDHEARAIRGELAARDRGRGKRYPEALRARVTAWLRRQVSSGAAIQAAAAIIEFDNETARRWLRASSPPATALVPVEVVAAPDARRAVSVVSPTGYRIDGLTLEEAVVLLRRLG
jgi:hypothetical protein